MANTELFVEVVGNECGNIRLVGNALDSAKKPYALINAAEDAIIVTGNTGTD
jgi:hypothetical protein